MRRVMIVLGMVLILIGLVGCGKSTKESIVGKWQEVDGTQTIEFFKDGTIIIVDKEEPPVTGDYKFIDDNRIRMDFKGIGELFGAVIAEYQPKEDEIVLTNPMGKIEKYKRSAKPVFKRGAAKFSGRYRLATIRGNEVEEKPDVFTFEQNGSVTSHIAGTWEVESEKVKLSANNKAIESGQIKDNSIGCFGVSFTRKKDSRIIKSFEAVVYGKSWSATKSSPMLQFAKLDGSQKVLAELAELVASSPPRPHMARALPNDSSSRIILRTQTERTQTEKDEVVPPRKKMKKFVLWSEYAAEPSEEVESGTLKFNKDGTYSANILMSLRWKTEDGHITLWDGNRKDVGKVEGRNLVFVDENGDGVKFIRLE